MKRRAQSSCLTANSNNKSRRRNINIKKDDVSPDTVDKSKPI